MKLAKEVGAKNIRRYTNSQLVQGQVFDKYQTEETALIKYYYKVKVLTNDFDSFEVLHIPREDNIIFDFLSKLVSTRKPSHLKIII